MIAGFEHPDAGEILLRGQDVTRLPPQQCRIGIVFQDYALFPHMSLGENVAFAMRHVPKAKRAAKAREWLDLVGLADLAARMPDQLSGGQQQRVALARTLAAEPDWCRSTSPSPTWMPPCANRPARRFVASSRPPAPR